MRKSNTDTTNAALYKAARELAQHADPKVRGKVAARKDINLEILFYLADDLSVDVRTQIAENPAAPVQANALLADDANQSVREGLARKLARQFPNLSHEDQEAVSLQTSSAIRILARDQVIYIRQILAEALKDIAHAPPDVINQLARDADLSVCKPILEFSPVLTDADLLEIISSDLVKGALSAISRRPHVSEDVVDAIVDSNETEAITELLGNPNTQIREETLDQIISRASNHELWHAPLATRPRIPPRAALRLASFITEHFLSELVQRNDLDIEEVNAVRSEVLDRFSKVSHPRFDTSLGPKKLQDRENLTEAIKAMEAANELNENGLKIHLDNRETELVTAALSHLSDISYESIEKMISVRSRKGLVAVTWKAGLSMEFAEGLQQLFLDMTRKEILKCKAPRAFPLSEELMEWQLDFLTRL